MGLLDNELRPHMDAMTQFYKREVSLKMHLYQRREIPDPLDESEESYRLKVSKTAEILRQQGNEFFKARDFNAALQMYTKSISQAINKGQLASLAYSNRSAVLYHMKLFEDCIQDIDRALETGYPLKEKLYTLYLRRAKSLKYLNKDHVSSLADAMKAIKDQNKTAETKRLSELVLRAMEEPPLPDLKEELPKSNNWKLPELSYGANPEVPSYSSAVDLRHSKEFGRHVVANRSINTGDVLVVEKSVVTCTYLETQWNYCNFCLKLCYALIPCKNYCGKAMYCSEYCQNSDANTAHKEHCKFRLEDHPLKQILTFEDCTEQKEFTVAFSRIVMLYRLIGCIGLDNIKKTAFENKPLKSFVDPRTKGFHDGKLEKASLEALLSLEDNFDKLTREERDGACERAFQTCGILGIAPKDWLSIGVILLKLCLVIEFNCTSMYHYKVNYRPSKKLRTLHMASGLFLANSLINHSCNANANPVSYGDSMVIRANNPISKGEQITICYGLPAYAQILQERQEELLKNLKFKCSCVACIDVLSTIPNDSLVSLKRLERQLEVWLAEAGVDSTNRLSEKIKVMHLTMCSLPVPKPMMPMLLKVLKICHNGQSKPNKWYYKLNRIIWYHYRTQGNCFFVGDSEKILNGEMEFPII